LAFLLLSIILFLNEDPVHFYLNYNNLIGAKTPFKKVYSRFFIHIEKFRQKYIVDFFSGWMIGLG